MCDAKEDGGRRCPKHLNEAIARLSAKRDNTEEGSPEYEALTERINATVEELRATPKGLKEHIARTLGTGEPYDAPQMTSYINKYIEDHPDGRPLTLPGGKYRVRSAHTYGTYTILEVSGPTSARSYNKLLRECYDADAIGKQVTVASGRSLEKDFSTMLVHVDGRAATAVKPSGEISGVVSMSSHPRLSQSLIPAATDRGGKYLECFNTFLPRTYKRAGFVKVASIPFIREFAPKGWDYEHMSHKNLAPPKGEPDIIFMASAKHYEQIGRPEFRTFNDYDDAETYTRGEHQ